MGNVGSELSERKVNVVVSRKWWKLVGGVISG
jgi:hypothetical protein